MNSPRRVLILLLAVALVIRLGWALTRPAELAGDLPDQAEYLAVAQNLIAGQGLRFHDPRFDDDVVAFRAPGYPLLMAACGVKVSVIRITQAVLDASLVLAAYLLTRRFAKDEWLAVIAGAIAVFNPYLVFFSSLILSETLFTVLMVWGMVLASRKTSEKPVPEKAEAPAQRPKSAIPMERRDVPLPPAPAETAKPQATWNLYPLFGAILLALAVLTRPGAMVLPALLMGAGAWVHRERILPRVLLGAAVTFLVLLPWAWRNHSLLGQWVWTTTNAGHTAYDGFGPSATGGSDLNDLRTMSSLQHLDEVGRDRLLGDTAKDYMINQPGRSLKLAAVKIARTWSPMPLSQGYGRGRNVAIGLGYSLPFFVLILVGLVRKTIPVRVKVLCAVPAIYFTAMVALSVGSLRYRIPAEPPMAVIAAAALRRRKLPVASC